MNTVKISELRANLQKHIDQVQSGKELDISVRGKVVARLVPAIDRQAEAKKYLKQLRKTAIIGDIETPLNIHWKNDPRDNS